MGNLLTKTDCESIIARLNKLTAQSTPLWGKMNVGQMLAHCAITHGYTFENTQLPRIFLGYFIGPWFLRKTLKAGALGKSLKTSPMLIVSDERDFEQEKAKVLALLHKFQTPGASGIRKEPHPFFGKMSTDDWGQMGYIHLDHHLKQFGC